ncbi:MAG: PQQ-like beta-propeller repeat protein [Armatimonadetes bacterium]|nr:PQQ-like beta-propeller repeat protein [Armatimonadota bacterium]
MKFIVYLSACLVASQGVAYAAHPWPMWHRDVQRGGQAQARGPQFPDIVWSADLGASKINYASPVIDEDGRAYIGTSDGKLHCIQADGTSAPGWPYDTGAVALEFDRTPSTPAPAVATDGSVYILDALGRLHEVSSNGTFQWRFDTLGVSADTYPGILPNGDILITTYQFLSPTDGTGFTYVIHPNGTEYWHQTALHAPHVLGSPSADPAGNIYTTGFAQLFKYGPDGTPGWIYNNGSSSHMYSSPAYDPTTGRLILTDIAGSVVAVPTTTNAYDWKSFILQSPAQTGVALSSDGYGVGNAYGSKAIGFRTSDGVRLWKRTFPGTARATPSMDSAKTAYFGVSDGTIRAFTRVGQLAWSLDMATDASSTAAFDTNGDMLIGLDTPDGARLVRFSAANELIKTVAGARTLPDSTAVTLPGKPVTYAGSGFFYIQDWDGIAGIRVVSNEPVDVGDVVNVSGTLGQSGQERAVLSTSVLVVGTGDSPDVRVMLASAAGGGTVGANNGASGGVGLNTVGLLIRVVGKVVSTSLAAIPPTPMEFLLDDGSPVASMPGQQGLLVSGPHADLGEHAIVTGVVSLRQVGSQVIPVLLVRSIEDYDE